MTTRDEPQHRFFALTACVKSCFSEITLCCFCFRRIDLIACKFFINICSPIYKTWSRDETCFLDSQRNIYSAVWVQMDFKVQQRVPLGPLVKTRSCVRPPIYILERDAKCIFARRRKTRSALFEVARYHRRARMIGTIVMCVS